MMTNWIFRLCTEPEWAAFRATGDFPGNAGDHRDGFLHFSMAEQVAATAKRHYPAEGTLVLMAILAAPLRESLRWEESRNGALFPHLYGRLPLSAVVAWRNVPDRTFVFLTGGMQLTEAEGWTCIP
ncbi:MAG: DUF952 domain-containing protein [Rhodospirillaceae bacterium]|nr:DUF952 domain-containing protein [Rhodospirillaceae bacterium]